MPTLAPVNIASQFPDYPIASLPAMWDWEDVSWHNDTCPSFRKTTGPLGPVLVWVDWPDPREREDFDGRRFILCRLDDEGCLPPDEAPLLETDSWEEVLALVGGCQR